ncbi:MULTISPECIES: hypothetical protein [unclassified Nocardioides]|uniref:hypothetical protein n=1 Tax=unclassified Nocardioides TaxID=2615069 RepID=UPI0006F2E768|nr:MULTISPECIES: hypothetical protein [unclassified Nocardioides]KRA28167.1 hypothetical protein ASD81_23745 [Nocardioides sp. Root614]KRA86141.1 hypothetical protein ASD84_23985 [Nocardioides sp. Root682]
MTPPDEWTTYNPDSSPDEEPSGKVEPYRPPAPPTTPVAPRTLQQRTIRQRRSPVLPLLGAVVAIGLVGWGVVAIVKAAVGSGEPQTAEGFANLLEDLEDETGSTDVFRAVVYPEYAVVDVPVAANDEREISYYWDGGLSESTKGTSDDEVFDLTVVDAAQFAGMCAEVSALIDEPGDCYLIIEKPDDTFPDRANAWISAYVSNEFSQSKYINYDLEGNEVDRSED